MPNRHAAAFTLVEMLTVVIVILLLLGMGVALGRVVINHGARTETQARLGMLKSVLSQFESATGTKLDLDPVAEKTRFDAGTGAFDFADQRAYVRLSSQYFVSRVRDHADAGQTLSTLIKGNHQYALFDPHDAGQTASNTVSITSASAARIDDGLIDGWGNPIVFKSRHVTGGAVGADSNTNDFLPAPNGGGYFASAGPDGKFGAVIDMAGAAGTAAAQATGDNMHSFNVPEVSQR